MCCSSPVYISSGSLWFVTLMCFMRLWFNLLVWVMISKQSGPGKLGDRTTLWFKHIYICNRQVSPKGRNVHVQQVSIQPYSIPKNIQTITANLLKSCQKESVNLPFLCWSRSARLSFFGLTQKLKKKDWWKIKVCIEYTDFFCRLSAEIYPRYCVQWFISENTHNDKMNI